MLDALASSAIDFASERYGINKQQKFNRQEARENREWQERMSNTQYQRAAKDLEAAGLNRIIALGSPASTPSGSAASSSATTSKPDVLGRMLVKQQLTNAKQTEKVLKEEVELKKQMGNKAYQEWQNSIAQLPGIVADSRGKGYEADKQQLLKVLYDKPGKKAISELDRLFDFLGIGQTSSKGAK